MAMASLGRRATIDTVACLIFFVHRCPLILISIDLYIPDPWLVPSDVLHGAYLLERIINLKLGRFREGICRKLSRVLPLSMVYRCHLDLCESRG